MCCSPALSCLWFACFHYRDSAGPQIPAQSSSSGSGYPGADIPALYIEALLKLDPEFTAKKWLEITPHPSQKAKALFLEGIQKAGLPEWVAGFIIEFPISSR
jgi:hypothetical protein